MPTTTTETTISPSFDAVLFDLDGVLTSTAALHAACWKQTFDEVLDEPFDIERDHLSLTSTFPGSVRWVEQLRRDDVRTAVVSSSANASAVLAGAGIGGLFDVIVDGNDIERLGLPGKPAPDGFVQAAVVVADLEELVL